MTGYVRLQDIQDLSFLTVAYEQVYGVILRQTVRPCLYITPDGGHDSLGIHLLCLMEHLPGFLIRNVRHGTCVDDVYIRPRGKRTDLVTGVF